MSKISSLYVCPLKRVEKVVAETKAQHLVSILDAKDIPSTPASISPQCHFKIATDVQLPPNLAQTTLDSLNPIQSLLAFARSWPRTAPIVVHCMAGLSRSTAAAFAILCALNDSTDEIVIAQELRARAAFADPDSLITALADKTLKRNGRMQRAIENLNDALPVETGTPFSIPTLIQANPNSGKTNQKAA